MECNVANLSPSVITEFIIQMRLNGNRDTQFSPALFCGSPFFCSRSFLPFVALRGARMYSPTPGMAGCHGSKKTKKQFEVFYLKFEQTNNIKFMAV